MPQDNTVAIELTDDAADLTDAAPEAVTQTEDTVDDPARGRQAGRRGRDGSAASAGTRDGGHPDDGQVTLSLAFSGDCWTEISDGSGRRLYFDQGSDGRTVELRGVAPFNVLFGNAGNVTLRVDGAAYDVGPADRWGRARFTISGN